MRVLRVPAPSPFLEVDPSEVTVIRIGQESLSDPILSAWGVLTRDERWEFEECIGIPGTFPGELLIGGIEHGPEYRVAYTDTFGNWQAEGTLERTPPPEPILKQIQRLMVRTYG